MNLQIQENTSPYVSEVQWISKTMCKYEKIVLSKNKNVILFLNNKT